jgi:hypothetical protein
MRPTVPSLEAFKQRLEPAWERAWLTNDGMLTEIYRAGLRQVPGLRFPEDLPEVDHNYAYSSDPSARCAIISCLYEAG